MASIILAVVLIAHFALAIYLLGLLYTRIFVMLSKKNFAKMSLILITLFMLSGVLWSARSSVDSWIWPFLYAVLIFSSPLITLILYCHDTRRKKKNPAILVPLGLLSVLPSIALITSLASFLTGPFWPE